MLKILIGVINEQFELHGNQQLYTQNENAMRRAFSCCFDLISATKRLYGAVVLSFRITTGFIQVRIEEPTPLIETLFQVIIFYFVMK